MKVRPLLPGLVLAFVVGAAGKALAAVVPLLGGVTLAIVLGIVVGNLLGGWAARFDPGLRFTEKRVLEAAIVLLGLDLQFGVLASLGWTSLFVIVGVVALTVPAGLMVGRMLGLSASFGLFLGVGSGVCGASAIAAVAPLVPHEEEEVGLSVSAINLVGTLGIFLLPALVVGTGLSEEGGGLLIGGSLPAVGHVVAAGFSVSEAVGGIATVVKMGRVLLLGPLVLVIAGLVHKQGRSRGALLPWFIVGFFLLSALSSFGLVPEGLAEPLRDLGRWLLTVAMAAIGLRIRMKALLVQGPRALFGSLILVAGQVAALWVVVAMLL